MSDQPDPFSDDAALLRQYLASRDVPCPLCGYNLHAIDSRNCPECGKAIQLQVGLVDPRMVQFVAGIIPIAGTFGFALLTLIWMLYMTLRLGPGPPLWGYLALVGQVVVSAVILFAWIRSARWIRSQTVGIQALMISLSWLLPIVCLVVFLIIVETF